jgi:ribosomal protein S18 acetylase RimI-like enzyme
MWMKHPKPSVGPHASSIYDSASSNSDPNAIAGLLDNPIWNALRTEHSALALGNRLALRYPAEIGPLSGIPDQSAASYEALRTIAGPGGVVALFFEDPPSPPPGWMLLRDGLLYQMICLEPATEDPTRTAVQSVPAPEFRRLSAADVPAMIELAELTEPGPFHHRTIELGVFFGIFHSGRLLGMAGQRLQLPQFIEVSAVCTHPEARERGYARALMAKVIADIRSRGKTPILHVFASNSSAISVYKTLGFTHRRSLHLAVLRNEA